jgi:hypothetical protein
VGAAREFCSDAEEPEPGPALARATPPALEEQRVKPSAPLPSSWRKSAKYRTQAGAGAPNE